MPINTSIKLQPKYAPSEGLANLSGAFSQSVQNFGKFFDNFIQQKRQKAYQLAQVVNKLESETPLFEDNQLKANEKIQELQEYIGELKRKNKQKGVFQDWTDQDLIDISAKATKLQRDFATSKQEEKSVQGYMDQAMKNPDKFDVSHTLESYLAYRESGQKPANNEWLKAMPNNFMEEFAKIQKERGQPKKTFVGYENGKRKYKLTYGVTDTDRRNRLAGMLSDPKNIEGANVVMKLNKEYENYVKVGADQKVRPEELWAVKNFKDKLWQDQDVYEPLTNADREALGIKKTGEDKDKRDIVKKQGDSWNLHAKPIKLTGYKGAKELYVTALKYGQPPGTMAEGLYFEVYKKPENITEESTVEYIPYNEISSMVEKSVKFEGLEEAKKGAKPISYENPSATDMSKLNPNLDEWDQYLRK